MTRSCIAALTALALLCPRPATAAPEAEVDPMANAKAAHADAQVAFDSADYAAAISLWTVALRALPRADPKAKTYRSLILYNIAAAREKLFELRGDVAELKAARILLVGFERAIDELYGDDPETAQAERTRVLDKLAALDARIAEAERPDEPQTPPDPRPDADPGPDQPPDPRPEPPPSNAGRGMIIGGAVLLGVGVAAIGGLGASLAIGEKANDITGLAEDNLDGRVKQFERGDQANAAAIAMGVLSPLLVGAGVALVVVGVKQRRQAKTSVSIGPGRISIAGRF